MKDKIVLSMSEKKLAALEMYLAQKSSMLSDELNKYAEQLYSKIVPQNVREYIEMTSERRTSKKPCSSRDQGTG